MEGWTLPGEEPHKAGFSATPDGRFVIVRTEGLGYLVDRQTGQVREWERQKAELVYAAAGWLRLKQTAEFSLPDPRSDQPVEALLSPDGKRLFLSLARLYRVDPAAGTAEPLGEALGEKRFPGGIWPSPAGELVAWGQDMGGFTPALVMGDAAGEPRFRALGAHGCYEWTGAAGNRWLAHGSAMVVRTQQGLGLLAPSGDLRELPGARQGQFGFEPFPAPDDTGLFAFHWHDENGVRRLGVVLEMHLGGHGACGEWGSPLPAKVERPPLGDRITLQVTGTGDCLNIRLEPSTKAGAFACLPDGAKVTVTGNPPLRDNWGPRIWGDSHEWVYVSTGNGQKGWAALSTGNLTWAD